MKIHKYAEKQKNYENAAVISKSVKDMPEYDPDAEISSMIYTIPSWINSISRLISTDFSKVTNNAKLKLLNELDNLAFNIELIKISIGEGNE